VSLARLSARSRELKQIPPSLIDRADYKRHKLIAKQTAILAISTAAFPTSPTLRPKLRKVPRRSFSMAMAFDCSLQTRRPITHLRS
jgi:hypothetical protein